MRRETPLSVFKTSVTGAGGVALIACIAVLSVRPVSLGFPVLILFSILLAPRISLAIPRSNIAVSFSDALIFLAFLMYGPEASVVLATAETLSNCYYNKWKGNIKFGKHMIVTNVSVVAISTAASCVVWFLVSRVTDVELFAFSTRNLLSTLGILALVQFCLTTGFAALYRHLRDGSSIWQTWKRDCFSSSMSQVVGAGIAGIGYKIINFGDLIAAGVALAVAILVYLTYRQSIYEMNAAIAQVEEAERQKAETERERRREAEKHAFQLTRSLEKEEMTNAALRKSEKDFQ